jgi:hypothetical protein
MLVSAAPSTRGPPAHDAASPTQLPKRVPKPNTSSPVRSGSTKEEISICLDHGSSIGVRHFPTDNLASYISLPPPELELVSDVVILILLGRNATDPTNTLTIGIQSHRKCYTYGHLRMIYALTRTESDVATKKMQASC